MLPEDLLEQFNAQKKAFSDIKESLCLRQQVGEN